MKVLITDDDKLVLNSLAVIISGDPDCEVCGKASGGEEAISLYNELSPDVLLMDIRMGGMNGLEAGTRILEQHPDARILYLTTFKDDEYLVKALTMGAAGYIIKQDFDSIIPALKAVAEGQTVFAGEVTDRLNSMIDKDRKRSSFDGEAYGLTPQEIAVCECVARGLSNKEIGDELFLSEGTVRNYLSVILKKLDVRDRTNLAIFYLTNQKP